MLRPPYLTDRERAAVQALLVDRLVVRYASGEADLSEFLQRGLRVPDVALPVVKASALADDAELRRLVARFVTSLSDFGLIEELRRTQPDSRELARLGFDPFDHDRATAYCAAGRLLNVRQAIVATAAGAIVGLMILFPPWNEALREKRTMLVFLPQESTTLETRRAGYAFLFAPPKSQTVEQGPNDRALYGDRWVVREYWVDLPLLGLQIAGVALAAGAGVWALRGRRYRAEDFAGSTAKGP